MASYLDLLKEKIKGTGDEDLLKLLSKAEAELNTHTKELEKKLKTFTNAFGEDESTYPEKAKKLAEYDILLDKLQASSEKLEAMAKQNKLLARDNALTKQCSQLNIDLDALKVLLDDSVEVTEEGVVIEGKAISLDKYIEKDGKLSKFKASLFTSPDTPKEPESAMDIVSQAAKTMKKGTSKPASEDDLDGVFNQYLNKYWADKPSKIQAKLAK